MGVIPLCTAETSKNRGYGQRQPALNPVHVAADAHLPYSRKAVCSSANCILQARNCKRRSLPYPDEKVEDACMDGADEQAQAYKPADPYADRVMIWYPEDTDGLPDDLRAALETGLCLTSAQRNRFFALADARAAASAPGETAPSPSEGGERGADAAARAECGSEVAAAAAGAPCKSCSVRSATCRSCSGEQMSNSPAR